MTFDEQLRLTVEGSELGTGGLDLPSSVVCLALYLFG